MFIDVFTIINSFDAIYFETTNVTLFTNLLTLQCPHGLLVLHTSVEAYDYYHTQKCLSPGSETW